MFSCEGRSCYIGFNKRKAFFALRRAFGPFDTPPSSFFFYTHERRVDGSALNNMHDFGHNISGYARSYLLSFGSAKLCPPRTRFVHFCTRFCPNGVAAYSCKSLLGTFLHMKTLMLDCVQETSGCTRFCPSPK